ncbi:MAG: GldL-related protein [Moheibacter sp.]
MNIKLTVSLTAIILGIAVVILGAFFKINHLMVFDAISGNHLLLLGFLIEAIGFFSLLFFFLQKFKKQ